MSQQENTQVQLIENTEPKESKVKLPKEPSSNDSIKNNDKNIPKKPWWKFWE